MKEEWKDITGYEGLYQVSNTGKVKSLNYRHTGKEKIMKPVKNKDGYLQVGLCKEGIRKFYLVHQLVGNVFLSNPQGYKELNHKDECKTNNCVENLEFCDRQYNIEYSLCKPVFSVDKESGLIMWWQSAREAGRTLGIAYQNISACLKGKQKSAKGFYFFYAESEEVDHE